MVLATVFAINIVVFIGSRPPTPPPGTNGILYSSNPYGGRAPGGYRMATSNGFEPGSFGITASPIGRDRIKHDELTTDLFLKQRSVSGPEPRIELLRTMYLVAVPVGHTYTDGNVMIKVLKIWRSSTTDDLRVYLHVTFDDD